MLVAFEGIDACGKQTQVELLRRAAVYQFPSCQVFTYPDYTTRTGQTIKRLLDQGSRDPMVLQCLMTANRYEQQHVIQEELEHGALVILDRYWLSGLVYGLTDGLPDNWLIAIHDRLIKPDHWFILDMESAESFRRRPDREDEYEASRGRMVHARIEYKRAARWLPNAHMLDATQSPEQLHQQVMGIIGG